MQDYYDFTYDAEMFPVDEMNRFVAKLHQNGQKFVPIIDPGIAVAVNHPDYEAYTEGIEKDLFIKNIEGENFLGQVWPGNLTYVARCRVI